MSATDASHRNVRAHSNAHSASNKYLLVLRKHYSEIFPLFLDASFVTASCFQMQVDATKLVKCFSVSGCKVSRPCSVLNVWHRVAFNRLRACCKSAISVLTILNSNTQANSKIYGSLLSLKYILYYDALTRGNCAMAALCKPQVNKFFQSWVLSLNFLPLTPPLRKPPNRQSAQ